MNIHGVSTVGLTRGIQGKNILPVSKHLADESAEVVDVLGPGLKTQLSQDLKKLHQAVQGTRGCEDMALHTAAMAAGSLLGVSGLVVQQMAGKLHQAVRNPEQLKQFAAEVAELPQQKEGGAVFSSLSNRVLQSQIGNVSGNDMGTAMFLGGGFLAQEQQQGTLLDFQLADFRPRQ
ncbi:hypothetical protein JST97_21315 [bacterium]|nr:hypothetical protein [bacterium]